MLRIHWQTICAAQVASTAPTLARMLQSDSLQSLGSRTALWERQARAQRDRCGNNVATEVVAGHCLQVPAATKQAVPRLGLPHLVLVFRFLRHDGRHCGVQHPASRPPVGLSPFRARFPEPVNRMHRRYCALLGRCNLRSALTGCSDAKYSPRVPVTDLVLEISLWSRRYRGCKGNEAVTSLARGLGCPDPLSEDRAIAAQGLPPRHTL